MHFQGVCRWGVVCLTLVLGAASAAMAQSIAYSQIQGVVKDQSGGVVPGVQVTIRSVDTGIERTAVTDDSGRYVVANLRPGYYEVQASQPGFATVLRTGIQVEVGGSATVDLQLSVAGAAQTLTVTSATPVLETEKAGFTATISETSVENLPINGRRWENFVLLTPTTQPDGDFGLVSYRGISGLYNNNMVDGADNNQGFFSEARGRTRVSYTTSQAAIKEFQVGVSNYSAEFGRAVGGTVNAVTKSGTNDFHGQAFYFIRDDAFNANEPFNNAEGFDKLPERRQQFGFNLGGPLKRGELFYFLNYDQQIRNFPGVAIDDNGFTDGNGNIFISPSFDITSICTFDAARCSAARDLLLTRMGVFGRKGLNEIALGKLDWNISDADIFGVQYNWHQWRSPNGIQTQDRTNDTALANGFDGVRTDFFLTRYTRMFGPDKLNEFRFQLGRDDEFQRGNTDGPSIEINRDIDIDDGQREFLPRIKFPEEYRVQFVDNFTWIRGNHLFKFGLDVNYLRDEQINLFKGNGEFRYDNFDDFAMDVPLPGLPVWEDGNRTGRHYRDYQQAFDLISGGIGRIKFSTTDWNFFLQDTIKVTPDFTLTLGVRYEFTDNPQPDQNIFSNPTPEWLGLPSNFQALGRHFNSDKNNWGPRVGLAWDVGGKHRFVSRAGYGVYYGRTSNSALAAGLFENNAITRTSLFFASFANFDAAPVFPNTFCDPPLGIDSNSRCVPPPDVDGSVTLNLFSDDYVRPVVHSWDLALDFGLTDDMNLSLTYIGSRAQRLPAFIDANLPEPSDVVTFQDQSGNVLGRLPFYAGPRPISTFSSIILSESTVNSWYHGFVLRLKRRFRDGFSFDSHLTISKALDDGQGSTTFFAFFSERVDPRNRALDYGPSNFDIRKKWISQFVWDPHFENISGDALRKAFEGFVFSGILTLRDGRAHKGEFLESVPFSLRGPFDATSRFSGNGSGADNRVPWLGRNFGETTGFASFDLRVTREIRFTDNVKASIVWEAFNLFNRVNFTRFNDNSFAGTAGCTVIGGDCVAGTRVWTVNPVSGFLSPQAASNTLSGPREMQLAFKFSW